MLKWIQRLSNFKPVVAAKVPLRNGILNEKAQLCKAIQQQQQQQQSHYPYIFGSTT